MSEIKKPVDLTKSDKHKPKPALNFLLLGAGSMFTSMIVAGFLVGYLVDMVLKTTPIFMLGFGVLGFIGGIQKVHKLLEKMDLMDPASLKMVNKEESKKDVK